MENLVKAYKNKKVFITGHTGFKGSWLSLWLTMLGAEVCGYALEPDTNPSLFNVLDLEKRMQSRIDDINDSERLLIAMRAFVPDIVFHLAAQPLVGKSYSDPINTYNTNIMGTLNVLDCAKKCSSVKALINVTTDKCYENNGSDTSFTEDDKLGGYDMYSSSKACSEILTSSFRDSFLKDGYALASARAGNVIGGGDWAQDRLLPDCVRAFEHNNPIVLRNKNAIRPWQYVLDALYGYLLLGEKLLSCGQEYAQAFNFGTQELIDVETVVNYFVNSWGSARIETMLEEKFHEAPRLTLDSSKAKQLLGWAPKYNVKEAVIRTAKLYKNYSCPLNMISACKEEISEYMYGDD